MLCIKCEKEPCECPKSLAVQEKPPKWLIQYCGIPGCEVAIRVPIAQPLIHPICKWHDQGIAYIEPSKELAGMPNVDLPWPWMTEADREKKLRLPYWKERLRRHGDLYQAWFRT